MHERIVDNLAILLKRNVVRIPLLIAYFFVLVLCLGDFAGGVLFGFPANLLLLILAVVLGVVLVATSRLVKYWRISLALRSPLLYWLLFLLVAVFAVHYLVKDNPHHFDFARSRPYWSFTSTLLYVSGVISFSDSRAAIPTSSQAILLVNAIKGVQAAFLIWFIAYYSRRRARLIGARDLSSADYKKCDEYMDDIVEKSAFVDSFYRQLQAEIEARQQTVEHLEIQKAELDSANAVQAEKVAALVGPLRDVVGAVNRQGRRGAFLSGVGSSLVAGLLGYLVGKLIEAIVS